MEMGEGKRFPTLALHMNRYSEGDDGKVTVERVSDPSHPLSATSVYQAMKDVAADPVLGDEATVESLKQANRSQFPDDYEKDQIGFNLERQISLLDDAAHNDDNELGENADLLRLIRQAKQDLSIIERNVEDRIGKQMVDFRTTIVGVGTLEKHRRKSRTQWKKDELLHDVLDTKLFNAASGELLDESPLDKVLHVWNLGQPRTTALRERGLAADEYCNVEDLGGYSIKLIAS